MSSSDEGLSGTGRDDEVAAGMFREEASKEKLGFESHWDSAADAEVVVASGKRGNRENGAVLAFCLSPSTAGGTAVVVVVDGEGSDEGSMAGLRCRGRYFERGKFWRLTSGPVFVMFKQPIAYAKLLDCDVWALEKVTGLTFLNLKSGNSRAVNDTGLLARR